MPLVRKINPEWSPRENPELEVGDTIDMSSPEQLIAEGHVELVKEKKESKTPVAPKKDAK